VFNKFLDVVCAIFSSLEKSLHRRSGKPSRSDPIKKPLIDVPHVFRIDPRADSDQPFSIKVFLRTDGWGDNDRQTKKELQENIDALRKELEEKGKLAEDRLNQLKYLQADFDNYRKNFERERENIVRLANEGLISDLLVVVDDFERALSIMKDGKDKDGVKMVYGNLIKILENQGLQPIETSGKKFDPNFHEVLCKEVCDKDDGLILEELQRGFMLKSRVIRPSKVKIAENQESGEKDG
jgi:molecular chaperone GrpE